VTGYLPELTDAYRGAQLAIAPLLRGAGLKFKVVQAIALGFPVVATRVGAEGVDDLVGTVVLQPAHDAVEFAEAIIRILQDWPPARDSARRHAVLLADRLDFRRQVTQQVAGYAELAGRP
jgi:glycosyltransferase involved in cell wall biosynthesis